MMNQMSMSQMANDPMLAAHSKDARLKKKQQILDIQSDVSQLDVWDIQDAKSLVTEVMKTG